MNSQKGFSIVILVAIISVLVIGGGIAAFLYITSNTSPKLESSAYTPSQVGITIPKTATSSGFKNPAETSTPAANPTAFTRLPAPPLSTDVPISLIGIVDVVTSVSSDSKTFTIKFESSSNFQSVNSVTYNLTYTTNSGQKSINGTFTVNSSTILPDSTNGKKYIQRDLTLGTCSSGTCVYDTSPTGFRVSVTTH